MSSNVDASPAIDYASLQSMMKDIGRALWDDTREAEEAFGRHGRSFENDIRVSVLAEKVVRDIQRWDDLQLCITTHLTRCDKNASETIKKLDSGIRDAIFCLACVRNHVKIHRGEWPVSRYLSDAINPKFRESCSCMRAAAVILDMAAKKVLLVETDRRSGSWSFPGGNFSPLKQIWAYYANGTSKKPLMPHDDEIRKAAWIGFDQIQTSKRSPEEPKISEEIKAAVDRAIQGLGFEFEKINAGKLVLEVQLVL